MTQKPDGGPAFPSEGEGHGNPKYHSPGMSLRDYFAGQALMALIGNHAAQKRAALEALEMKNTIYDQVSWQAFQYADAMIAARDAT